LLQKTEPRWTGHRPVATGMDRPQAGGYRENLLDEQNAL